MARTKLFLLLALLHGGVQPYSVGAQNIGESRSIPLSAAARLVISLQELGYDHVYAAADGSSLRIDFEYRMARRSREPVCKALELVTAGIRPFDRVLITLGHRGTAVTTVTMERSTEAGDAGCGGYRATDSMLDPTSVSHVGAYRRSPVDIMIQPTYQGVFGFYNAPFRWQVDVAPQINLRPWRGAELSGQMLVPVLHGITDEGRFVRPGLVNFSQFLRLPGPVFADASFGTFTHGRVGVDVRARTPLRNGRVWAGLDTGFTNGLSYPGGSIHIERDHNWTAAARFRIYLPSYKLDVGASAGRFLDAADGVRIDFVRQFGPIDVGFFAAQTSKGQNAGVNMRFPLFERPLWSSSGVRIRPAHELGWSYVYLNEVSAGDLYHTGRSLDELLRRYRPDVLLESLSTR